MRLFSLLALCLAQVAVSFYPFRRGIRGRGNDEGCDGGCNAVGGMGKQTTAKKNQ